MALDKLTTIQTSGIVATGIVTSNSYVGDGSGLTGVVGSGSGVVVQDDTSVVGTAGTIDFGTALDVSAISSGIVTVTASGGGSGSIAGIDTTATSIFSTLDIGADIDVDGHTELDNINIAGVTTFAGNIDANADIDIDGHTNLDNVSIAGVTTFSEDVKFTGATSGRDVTFDKSDDSLGFADNAKLKIGNSGDLEIFHGSNVNFIDCTNSFALHIQSNDFRIRKQDGGEEMITAAANGTVKLYHNGNQKLTTTNTGAVVTGILTATSFVGDGSALTNLPGGGSYGNSDVDTHLNRSSASSGEILSWNGSDYAWVADNVGSGSTAEVRSNTLTVSGVSTFTGAIDANGDLDVDGHTNLDNVNIAGVTTFSDKVIIGGGTSRNVGFEHRLQLEDTNDLPHSFSMISNRPNAFGAHLSFAKSRGSTRGSNTIVQDNDELATLVFRGADGTDLSTIGAMMDVRVDGTPGSNQVPASFEFHTRNASGALAERLIINSAGHLMPGADSTYNIGSSSVRFANIYADTLYGDGSNLTGVTGSIAGISTTGTSNFANIQLIGITTGLNVSGVLTAAQFSGDGANLTSLPAAQLSGTAAAINGSNITNLSAGNLSGTLPALDGSALTGIAVTEAPITNFTVTANGSSAYRFAGGGVNSSSNNPDLYLVRGQKYRFNNTTGSNHPFRFRESSGGSTYSSGVSGSENGVQFFMVPLDAPAQLVYQCTIHGGMVGNIYMRGAGGHNNNVGFTTFSNKIEVQSSSNTAATFKGSGGAGFINITDGDDGTLVFLGVDGGTFKVQTSGNSYSDKLVVDSSGRLGLNQSTPASRLHISEAGSNTITIQLTNATTGHTAGTDGMTMGYSTNSSAGFINVCESGSDFTIKTGGTGSANERFRLGSTGHAFFSGMTSLTASGSNKGINFENSSNNGRMNIHANSSAGNALGISFYNNGNNVGTIYYGTSSTAYNTSSDYRLKENQVAISDGIARLKTLKPYRFNFKVDPDKTVDGFFAHEVAPIIPEAVIGEKDAEDMQQLDYSKLTPLLTAALQEAITEIETLKAKVAALEGS